MTFAHKRILEDQYKIHTKRDLNRVYQDMLHQIELPLREKDEFLLAPFFESTATVLNVREVKFITDQMKEAQDTLLAYHNDTRNMLRTTTRLLTQERIFESIYAHIIAAKTSIQSLTNNLVRTLEEIVLARTYQNAPTESSPLTTPADYAAIVEVIKDRYNVGIHPNMSTSSFYTTIKQNAIIAVYDVEVAMNITRATIIKATPYPSVNGHIGPVIPAGKTTFFAWINSAAPRYVNLTILEAAACISGQSCTTSQPIYLVADNISCATSTFWDPMHAFTPWHNCHYQTSQDKTAFFYTARDRIHYAVPKPREIRITCIDTDLHDNEEPANVTLTGRRSFSLRPGCAAHTVLPPIMTMQSPVQQLGTVNATVYIQKPIVYYNHSGGPIFDENLNQFEVPKLNLTEYENIIYARMPVSKTNGFRWPAVLDPFRWDWDVFGLGTFANKAIWIGLAVLGFAGLMAIGMTAYKYSRHRSYQRPPAYQE
jgi:hypothetical protein